MLSWILSSSVLILIVVVLRYLLKGKISLRLQYALWGLVLLRLLLPISFGSYRFSTANAAEKLTHVQSATEARLPVSTGDAGVPQPSVPHITMVEGVIGGPDGDNVVITRNVSLASVLIMLWITGAGGFAAVMFASNLRFGKRLKNSRKPMDADGGGLPVYVSEELDTPCLFGMFSPAVYLSREAAEDPVVCRHAIAHETTHYRHGDPLWSFLRCIAFSLHWYNPLVWWAVVLSKRDAELACDESTIAALGEEQRAAYGQSLIRLTCEKKPSLLLTATTMTGSRRFIRERIGWIVKKPKMAVYAVVSMVLVCLLAVGCTFMGAKDTGSGVPEEVESRYTAYLEAFQKGCKAAEEYCYFVHEYDRSVFLENEGVLERYTIDAWKQLTGDLWAVKCEQQFRDAEGTAENPVTVFNFLARIGDEFYVVRNVMDIPDSLTAGVDLTEYIEALGEDFLGTPGMEEWPPATSETTVPAKTKPALRRMVQAKLWTETAVDTGDGKQNYVYFLEVTSKSVFTRFLKPEDVVVPDKGNAPLTQVYPDARIDVFNLSFYGLTEAAIRIISPDPLDMESVALQFLGTTEQGAAVESMRWDGLEDYRNRYGDSTLYFETIPLTTEFDRSTSFFPAANHLPGQNVLMLRENGDPRFYYVETISADPPFAEGNTLWKSFRLEPLNGGSAEAFFEEITAVNVAVTDGSMRDGSFKYRVMEMPEKLVVRHKIQDDVCFFGVEASDYDRYEDFTQANAYGNSMCILFGNYTLDENNYVVEGKWVPGIVLLYEDEH